MRNEFVRLTFAFQSAGRAIGAAFTPMLIAATKAFTDFVIASAHWITENRDLLYLWAIAAVKISAFGFALLAIGKTFQAVAAPIRLLGSGLRVVFSGVSVLLPILSAMVNPVILFTAALIGAATYAAYMTGFFGTAIKWIGGLFQDLKVFVGEVWSGMAGALSRWRSNTCVQNLHYGQQDRVAGDDPGDG